MHQLKTVDDIKQLGTILSFWAHPDDETFSCAGIMAAAVENGQQVVCVTATRGEEGVQDEARWPKAKLAEIRTQELADALEVLGVREHHFLDYRDGTLLQVPLEEGRNHVLAYIDRCHPDSILTFGPEGMTGHPDHQTVSRWVDAAVDQLDQPPRVYHAVELRERYERFMKEADQRFDIYFNIDQPPLVESAECSLCFHCPSDICRQKCTALKAMPSQTERMISGYDDQTLNEMFDTESFVEA